MRRWQGFAAAIAVGGMLLTACGSGGGGNTTTTAGTTGSSSGGGGGGGGSASGQPVKVGFLAPLSGDLAQNGTDETNGFRLGLKTYGTTVNGHKIEVTYEDAQASPAVALTAAKDLVQNKHVNVMEGPLSSAAIGAVAPFVVAQNKIPTDDLFLATPEQMKNYQQYGVGLTSGWDGYGVSTAAADYAYKTLGWRTATVGGFDFSFGWEVVGGFVAEFKKLGGTINKALWIPNNATDVSSYISAIPKSTNGVYMVLSGQVAVSFMKDYQSFGLKGKIPIVGVTQLTDQSALPSETPAEALGVLTGSQYCDGNPSSANQSFANAFHSAYNKWPSYYADAGYTKAYILVQALKSLGTGSLSEPAIAKAMRAVSIQAPRGPVSISPVTFSPIEDMYICKVEMVNGAMRNVPIKTYANVKPWGLLSQSVWMTNFAQQSKGRPST
ncbi:MAG: ABC transporter substrate-binding protein [Acidimicrobiales bacterium]